jgi:hypothetical protein
MEYVGENESRMSRRNADINRTNNEILMLSPIVRLGFDLWWLADTRRMEIIQYTEIEIWYAV